MMLSKGILVAAGLLGVTVLRVSAEGLKVGDTAPKLVVQEFIKGNAIKKFEKGKIYVVDFWATTCLPCLLCIPHLTELQKKNPDVVFIGVSVFEPHSNKVKEYVEKANKMIDYRVALDLVIKGKGSHAGEMAQTWLEAAGCSIPTVFIIDKKGKIAWIGDPADDKFEETLTRIYR